MNLLNLTKFSLLSVFVFFVVSCEENEFTNDINMDAITGICVDNGYLVFKNEKCFESSLNYLSTLSNKELRVWSSKLNYVSLKTTYEKREKLFNSTNDSIYINTNPLSNNLLSTLFNERGIIMIGNKIIKIQGQYSYTITDGNLSTLEKIENGDNVSSLSNVKVTNHTIKLESDYICKEEQEITKNQSQLRDSETSNILWQEGNRREYVKYISEINVFDVNKVLSLEIRGRAQTKFIYWGLAFDDEMVSAKVSLLSGTYNYPDNVIHTLTPVSGPTEYDEELVSINILFGLKDNVPPINFNDVKVKYTYIKHTGLTPSTVTLTWGGVL